MWGHSFTKFHMDAINGTSSDGDSPEKRLTYFMQLVAAAKLSFMDIQEQAIRDLLRLDRYARRQLLQQMMCDAADMLLESLRQEIASAINSPAAIVLQIDPWAMER